MFQIGFFTLCYNLLYSDWCLESSVVVTANFLTRSASGASGTDTQDFCFCRMPEHDAAIQLNLARSRQEVKHRNSKQHLVTFQNKTLWLTPAQKCQRRDKHKLFCWSFGQEHFTQTCNCGREWLCVYRGNSSASWRQLSAVLRRGGLKPQPVGIAGRRSKTRSDPPCSGHVSSVNCVWGWSDCLRGGS